MPQVQLTPDAAKDVQRLPTAIRARVGDVIVRLENWPNVSGAKPMRHELQGSYRVRTGDYRVLFTIKEKVVVVFRVDNRRDVYER